MMMNEDRRDTAIEHLLRQPLVDSGGASPAGACLDADTLAAWADGELGRNERSAVEAHAAGCARCRAMLAAVVKTTPQPSTPTVWWRRPALAWLVPLSAAAALVIWIAIPAERRREEAARRKPADAVAVTGAPALQSESPVTP